MHYCHVFSYTKTQSLAIASHEKHNVRKFIHSKKKKVKSDTKALMIEGESGNTV